MKRSKIVFVTGTDTGVGKTLLSALLLQHLRGKGRDALAMKPFCCGDRGDIEVLSAVMNGALPVDEITPFYFPEPLAPLVAARKHRCHVRFKEVISRIEMIQQRCEVLVIEGVGGLLVPLGRGYTVADLIKKLNAKVLIVAHNRLGTINHTLLTANYVQTVLCQQFKVVLMGVGEPDLSSRTNRQVLAELLAPSGVLELPYLGKSALSMRAVKKNAEKLQKTLARMLA